MDCYYINLDVAEDRKLQLEDNFAARKQPGWTLTRFPAIDKAYVQRNDIPGTAKPAQKGCYLSHQFLMSERLVDDKSYFILEDDAAFGAHTCALVDRMIKQIDDSDWDMLFTDVCIPKITTMFELLKYRRALSKQNVDLARLDLRGMNFAGSTAYIVNGKSKRKLHEVVSAYRPIDLPYDIYLRRLTDNGTLKIHTLFPFVTTLADDADDSQISKAAGDPLELCWNLFRRMIWTERNLFRCKSTLESIRSKWCVDKPTVNVADDDEELRLFTALFSSLAVLNPATL
jgi:GR25 family glycosyltransferase involved in LPS biosynthesis